jgi:hypothetical protein
MSSRVRPLWVFRFGGFRSPSGQTVAMVKITDPCYESVGGECSSSPETSEFCSFRAKKSPARGCGLAGLEEVGMKERRETSSRVYN